MSDPSAIRAVTLDLGGVVMGSPPHAIARYESSVVGWRKPDPRIYELACSELEGVLGFAPA